MRVSSLGKPKVIVDFGDHTGVDGMTVDKQGRIFAAVRSAQRNGIYVFSPGGKELAYLKVPALPTNCCFGRGDESNRLYITAGGGLYRIATNATGYHPAID
jgi:gluconolactonase